MKDEIGNAAAEYINKYILSKIDYDSITYEKKSEFKITSLYVRIKKAGELIMGFIISDNKDLYSTDAPPIQIYQWYFTDKFAKLDMSLAFHNVVKNCLREFKNEDPSFTYERDIGKKGKKSFNSVVFDWDQDPEDFDRLNIDLLKSEFEKYAN